MDIIATAKKYFTKYRELISYCFWGGMTTLVNYVAYFVCRKLLGAENYLACNLIAWIVAVVFAFVVNKIFVFKSRSWESRIVFRESWQFLSARIFSGVLDMAMMWFFVDVMGFSDVIIKIIANIIVIVLNYILSKLIIFRKK